MTKGMPDDFDLAQDREQVERDSAILRTRLDARRDRTGAGRRDCLDCGEAIPEARRRAVPNATRCAPHQSIVDRDNRLRR